MDEFITNWTQWLSADSKEEVGSRKPSRQSRREPGAGQDGFRWLHTVLQLLHWAAAQITSLVFSPCNERNPQNGADVSVRNITRINPLGKMLVGGLSYYNMGLFQKVKCRQEWWSKKFTSWSSLLEAIRSLTKISHQGMWLHRVVIRCMGLRAMLLEFESCLQLCGLEHITWSL